MQYRLFFLLIIISQIASAALTITDVSGGYSYIEKTTEGAITVYGGIAGQCDVNSDSETCSTCKSGTVDVCNTKNINPLLRFSVSFKTATNVSNKTAYLITSSDTAAAARDHVIGSTTISSAIASQTIVSISTTWGSVCQQDTNNFGDTNCTPNNANSMVNLDSARRIYVWIDLNGNGDVDDDESGSFSVKLNYVKRGATDVVSQAYGANENACSGLKGLCGFVLDTPGDEKLYFKNFFSSSSGAPNNFTDAPAWYGVALFYKQAAAVSNTITNSDPVKILTLNSNYQVNDDPITGLTNYQSYCVLMANVNKAQNILLFNTGGTPVQSCTIPSEVVGLLDDKHCFISTAAFGSDMATEVDTFRKFRDQFLLQNSWGAAFVKWYYQYGPMGARFISDSPFLKFVTRVMLYPLYYFSALSLQYGVMVALFIFAICLVVLSRFKFFIMAALTSTQKCNGNSKLVSTLLFMFVMTGLISKTFALDGFTKTHKEERPGATADGLIRVDKDGNYIYKVPPQNTYQSSQIKIGAITNPDISTDICQYNNTNNCTTVHYDDIYEGASGFALEYVYEYFFVRTKGKLGAQVGGAIQYASGHGRLASDPSKSSVESFSFMTVPLYGGLVYRFEYKDRQLIVPYAAGGGTYVVLAEKREDKSKVNVIGAPGFYAAGGGMLNLSTLDRDMGAEFETEYDIKNLWISAEYKFVSVNSEAFSLESGFFQAGLGFDF